jgi:hypothetical protein
VHVWLNRTFSIFRDSSEASEDDFDYREWVVIRGNSGLTWSDVLTKRVVAILGEAGIGKTFEFQHQAARLQQEDKAAFFLSLNQINGVDSVLAALDAQAPRFETWRRSNEAGYFFLDAMDEARLNGPPALQMALRAMRDVLRPHLPRVSCFISSRVTDWSVPGVRQALEQLLLKPIDDAEATKVVAGPADTDTLEVRSHTQTSSLQLEVYWP